MLGWGEVEAKCSGCCAETQLVGSLQGRHVAGGGREAVPCTLRGSGQLECWVSLSRVKQVLLAQAEAEKIRKIGEAEAFVIEAIGMAEAERMKLKAEALQQYGDAAQLALVLDALPEVRREQLSPAVGKWWGVPRLDQASWGHREAPCGVWGLYPTRLMGSSLTCCSSHLPSLPPPDRCQSGCSPLQSGRDRYSQRREQQHDVRGEPSAGRGPRLRARHHWCGSHKGELGTGSWQFLRL